MSMMKGTATLVDVATTRQATDPTVALLYEEQAHQIYAYAMRRVRDHMDADDVVAETFRRAVEHLHRYERRGAPISSWLYRIACNVMTDRHRRAITLSLDCAADAPDATPGPEQVALRSEQRRAVWVALAALPSAQRRVLWLHYGCDLRYGEIARALGQSEETIKQVAHRARCALRKRFSTLAATDREVMGDLRDRAWSSNSAASLYDINT